LVSAEFDRAADANREMLVQALSDSTAAAR
jgi:hypothetical protein